MGPRSWRVRRWRTDWSEYLRVDLRRAVMNRDGRPSAGSGDALADGREGRVFVRRPVPSDRDEFVLLMRASRSFHRPWATAATDPQRLAAYIGDWRLPDLDAMVVCRLKDRVIVCF